MTAKTAKKTAMKNNGAQRKGVARFGKTLL
jgi:hypothetical protein